MSEQRLIVPEITPNHDFSNMNICDKSEITKIKGFKIDEAFAEMVAKKASQLTAKIEALKSSNEKLSNQLNKPKSDTNFDLDPTELKRQLDQGSEEIKRL